MGRRLYAIWSILLVLVVSIAVLGPGCGGGQCTVEVKATLCGAPYPGAVGYTLTGPVSPIQGTSVPATHSDVDCGSWICGNVSGGPANAFLANIAPSATQVVSEGGTITFTLEFEENQDAAIECDTWTIDGVPIEDWPGDKYWNGENWEVWPNVCNIIDVHFLQWVEGCDGYQVALNETSWLKITQTAGPAATIVVIDDDCALNKTPAPIQKVSQVPSFDEDPVEKGMNVTLTLHQPTLLDVETIWTLEKCLNYTKSINWLGISMVAPMPHPCVLFELVLPQPGQIYTFTLQASAKVALINDVDVDQNNNEVTCPQLLYITIYT
jgi:hypothetical protein